MARKYRLEINTLKCVVFSGIVILALMVIFPGFAFSRLGPRQENNSTSETNCAETAKEHRKLAEEYQQRAAEYRKEAESHRKMLADFKKRFARNPKETLENPDVKKMRLHCEGYIKAADEKAQQADERANFHLMRAEELEGK